MFLEALQLILSEPMSLAWIIIGVVLGIIFGAIPGMSATMAIAIFLPITYGLTSLEGITVIVSLYVGGISGGLISAILLNMPGTPSSVATTFDGRPMALKGQADKALGAGIVFSTLGTILSIVALITVAPMLANVALKFGPHEYFAVTFFSLSLIITLSSSSLKKGMISGLLGLAFATVGLDAISSAPRFTFGIDSVRSGFDILTVLVGLYAITEVLSSAENVNDIGNTQTSDIKMKGFGITFEEFRGQIGNFFRSSIIGTLIGILPGVGGGTSNIVAYTAAKNRSKHPERFGKGELTGVVASESANNGIIGGAMIPLLTLGIPGDTATAMMLGALILHGITPGPMIFQTHGSLVYAIFIVLILATVVMFAAQFIGLKGFIKVLKVPKYYLLPLIIVLCGVGAFGLNNRIFDVGSIVFFGIIGYALSKFHYPLPPMVLGFILGPILEKNLRTGLIASQGNVLEFLTRPISGVIIIFTIAFIIYSMRKVKKSNKLKKENKEIAY